MRIRFGFGRDFTLFLIFRLQVTYPSGVSVDLGNELAPTQVKDIPTLKWDADAETFYTLLMFDRDAPARIIPVLREVRHWAVVNIPGDAVERGETVAEYIGCGPPKYTGRHRYVFLIYRQPDGKIESSEPFTSRTYSSYSFYTNNLHFNYSHQFSEREKIVWQLQQKNSEKNTIWIMPNLEIFSKRNSMITFRFYTNN